MIYYIYHSGFVLELEKSILIFDFYRIPTDKKNEEESFISKFIKRNEEESFIKKFMYFLHIVIVIILIKKY